MNEFLNFYQDTQDVIETLKRIVAEGENMLREIRNDEIPGSELDWPEMQAMVKNTRAALDVFKVPPELAEIAKRAEEELYTYDCQDDAMSF